jgi:hypothetical protein
MCALCWFLSRSYLLWFRSIVLPPNSASSFSDLPQDRAWLHKKTQSFSRTLEITLKLTLSSYRIPKQLWSLFFLMGSHFGIFSHWILLSVSVYFGTEILCQDVGPVFRDQDSSWISWRLKMWPTPFTETSVTFSPRHCATSQKIEDLITALSRPKISQKTQFIF